MHGQGAGDGGLDPTVGLLWSVSGKDGHIHGDAGGREALRICRDVQGIGNTGAREERAAGDRDGEQLAIQTGRIVSRQYRGQRSGKASRQSELVAHCEIGRAGDREHFGVRENRYTAQGQPCAVVDRGSVVCVAIEGKVDVGDGGGHARYTHQSGREVFALRGNPCAAAPGFAVDDQRQAQAVGEETSDLALAIAAVEIADKDLRRGRGDRGALDRQTERPVIQIDRHVRRTRDRDAFAGQRDHAADHVFGNARAIVDGAGHVERRVDDIGIAQIAACDVLDIVEGQGRGGAIIINQRAPVEAIECPGVLRGGLCDQRVIARSGHDTGEAGVTFRRVRPDGDVGGIRAGDLNGDRIGLGAQIQRATRVHRARDRGRTGYSCYRKQPYTRGERLGHHGDARVMIQPGDMAKLVQDHRQQVDPCPTDKDPAAHCGILFGGIRGGVDEPALAGRVAVNLDDGAIGARQGVAVQIGDHNDDIAKRGITQRGGPEVDCDFEEGVQLLAGERRVCRSDGRRSVKGQVVPFGGRRSLRAQTTRRGPCAQPIHRQVGCKGDTRSGRPGLVLRRDPCAVDRNRDEDRSLVFDRRQPAGGARALIGKTVGAYIALVFGALLALCRAARRASGKQQHRLRTAIACVARKRQFDRLGGGPFLSAILKRRFGRCIDRRSGVPSTGVIEGQDRRRAGRSRRLAGRVLIASRGAGTCARHFRQQQAGRATGGRSRRRRVIARKTVIRERPPLPHHLGQRQIAGRRRGQSGPVGVRIEHPTTTAGIDVEVKHPVGIPRHFTLLQIGDNNGQLFRLDNGVLTVTIPIREEAKPHRVAIKPGSHPAITVESGSK